MMNLTTAFVKQALESIRYIDLKDWASEAFGQSMLSKRKIVFSTQWFGLLHRSIQCATCDR
jgi:hypothetical protein